MVLGDLGHGACSPTVAGPSAADAGAVPRDAPGVELRRPRTGIRVDFEGFGPAGLECPRDGTWKELAECVACRHYSGSVASVHSLAVICRYRRGAAGMTTLEVPST